MTLGPAQLTRRDAMRQRARRRITVRWIAVLVATVLSATAGYAVAYAMDHSASVGELAQGGSESGGSGAGGSAQGDLARSDLTRELHGDPRPKPVCAPAPLPLILMSGSSTMEEWRTSAEDLAPMNTINIGVGATTARDQLTYLKPIVTKFAPDVIVMFAGSNDLAANGNAYADDLVALLNEYVDSMQQELPNTVLYFVSINTVPSRTNNASSIAEVNAAVANEATVDGVLRYIETNAVLLDGATKPNASLFRSDGLHLNEAGYDVFSQLIEDRLIADGFATSPCVFPDGTIAPDGTKKATSATVEAGKASS